MSKKYAVVGATGNVGREILQILAERGVAAKAVAAVASSRSIGMEVSFGEEDTLKVDALDDFDFSGVEMVLSSPGAKVSAEFAPRAAAAGAVVIDNSSQFRMDPDVPLVVPEVNPDALAGYRKKNIIANPNCSTIQMVVALKPLHDTAGIKRVIVSTYQSVSGAGKSGMDELFNQTRGVYMNEPEHKFQETFQKENRLQRDPPYRCVHGRRRHQGRVENGGGDKKILDPKIKVHATCVRVPVFIGHAEAINLELEKPLTAEETRVLLRDAPGVAVVDHRQDEGYVTPSIAQAKTRST